MSDVASWLFGRIGRGVYGAYTIPYILILAGLMRYAPGLWPLIVASPTIWMLLVAARRCRDLGRSGWWAVAPGVIGLFCAIMHELLWRVIGAQSAALNQLVVVLWLATIVLTVLMAVGLAVAKGDPGPNRFSAMRSRF